jgi:hypothetical protein
LNKTIYLSVCSKEQAPLRNELESVLQRAGMAVIPSEEQAYSEDVLLLSSKIEETDCSVHIIFPQYAPLANAMGISASKAQFLAAKKHLEANPNFRIFVWLPPTTDINNIEPQQAQFINEVKNNISKNMVFSNAVSAIQLVDDIRSILETKETVLLDINSTDIFLMSNQLDEIDANEIIDMLSDIVPVEKLNIIQDSDMDYSELCKQQIPKSKLAVIYFKESGDWALPFAQQVWKKMGGATSHTPILLIGDTDPQTNMGKKFTAPKVISLIVEGTLIPLEIKVQYDKITLKTS